MTRAIAAAILLSGAAHAQSLNAQGISRLNQDIASLWTQDGVPMAQKAAADEAQKLIGDHQVDSKTTLSVLAINSLNLYIAAAPGLQQMDANGARLSMPLGTSWDLSVDARVRVQTKLLFNIDETFNVTVAINGLNADVSMLFDSSDPAAPKLTKINPPAVRFNLRITSSNTLVSMVGWLGDALVNGVVGKALIAIGARVLAQRLEVMTANTPSVMFAGGPALAPVPRADLEGAAAKLGEQLEKFRTPFGPTLEMRFDQPYDGTWLDSLNDPNFNPGNGIAPHAYGDSGEMTGHYLAALGFQYAATHDSTAKLRAKRALATLRTLLTMRGEPGNMNRSIMPLWFLPPDGRPSTTYTPGKDYAAPWNGDLYFFSDYMSRDEYMGLFYGLSWAHDLFDDAAMKAEAQALTEMAIDYLVKNGWTWRRKNGTWAERWAGVLEEQYAWILSAWHGNPAKYQSLHDQYHGFADLIWTGFWVSAIDPYYQYYKFQLGMGAIHVLLQHETDPAAWMRAYQSVVIMRHFIGHHLNAHYNNTYLAFDPASKARLAAENENLLTRWLSWPRRRTRVDLHNDPTIEKVDYTPPLQPGSLYPEGNEPPKQVSKYPLPPDKRIGSGFMWSVSPNQLDPGYPSGPDPYIEGETLDFFLPYWMGRYYGAIVPPAAAQRDPSRRNTR